MAPRKHIFIILISSLAFTSASTQPFNGKIMYSITEQYNTTPFCTYFFNDHYIKKTDTSSGSLLVAAGFTEITWDLRHKTQYLINHGTRVIYYSEYTSVNPGCKTTLSDTSSISGHACRAYRAKELKPVPLKDKEDTLLQNSIYIVAKDWPLLSPPQSEGRYDPLHLGSGYIPLHITNWGGLLSSAGDGYRNIVEATEIKEKPLPDDFFLLPEGYEKKAFDEKTIRDLVRKAAEKRIDFSELARKIIREKRIYSIFD